MLRDKSPTMKMQDGMKPCFAQLHLVAGASELRGDDRWERLVSLINARQADPNHARR